MKHNDLKTKIRTPGHPESAYYRGGERVLGVGDYVIVTAEKPQWRSDPELCRAVHGHIYKVQAIYTDWVVQLEIEEGDQADKFEKTRLVDLDDVEPCPPVTDEEYAAALRSLGVQ